MGKLILWTQLEKKVARYYPKGESGRPMYPLSAMLRVHCMQLFYNLSNLAMEGAVYEIESMRQFGRLETGPIAGRNHDSQISPFSEALLPWLGAVPGSE